MWNSHRHIPDIPVFLGHAPPSPFFQEEEGHSERERRGQNRGRQRDKIRSRVGEFTRKARTVDEEDDPESYYNDWIMSNLG